MKNLPAHRTGYRFGFVVLQLCETKLPDRYDSFVVGRAEPFYEMSFRPS